MEDLYKWFQPIVLSNSSQSLDFGFITIRYNILQDGPIENVDILWNKTYRSAPQLKRYFSAIAGTVKINIA